MLRSTGRLGRAAPQPGARLWRLRARCGPAAAIAPRSRERSRAERTERPGPGPCPCPRPAASFGGGGGERELFRFSMSFLKGEEGERMNELLTAAEPRFPRLSNVCKYLCCGWSPPPRLSCLVCWLFVPNPGLCSV